MSDEGIRTTNNDASHCKRWCVEKGYFRDDYLKYFVHSTTAKAPEISRGYYVRYCGLSAFLLLLPNRCVTFQKM